MAVATIKQPLQLLVQNLFFILLFFSSIPISVSQTNNSPQNIEAFYPFPIYTAPSPAPTPPNNRPNSSFFGPVSPQLPPVQRKSSSNRNVVKAVAVTASSTFVVATLLFFLIHRFVIAPRRRKEKNSNTNNNNTTTDSRGGSQVAFMGNDQFSRMDGNLKGFIVDENGLDVLYWRKLEGNNRKNNLRKEVLRSQEDDEEEDLSKNDQRRNSEPLQERPLLLGKSSASHKKVVPETDVPERKFATTNNQSVGAGTVIKATDKPTSQSSNPPQLPRQPSPQPIQSSMAIPSKQVTGLPPPPPPPPPISAKKNHLPPPPPNLPPALKGMKSSNSEAGESSTGDGQVKLKPLHWDKVNKNTGHSMVWDKIDNGSFRFDDNLMEALFGTVATNRKSPKGESSGNLKSSNSSPTAQIVILDARRSQNIAIVLKSLAISRSELLDALNDGHGLNADTLEKLMKIAPTQEEQSQILEFDGSPTRLDDAESFIYHLLKAVPSAFIRLNAMLFRANYDTEIVQFKESLQILELACKELRNRGLFMKLLEAILKAGNRMNAGTSRGNAQAFKLNSLQKLSDVKSIDGKTTLLHFVVEEVVRSEGKRCVVNRNHSLNRSRSQSSNSSVMSETSVSKEEKEKEYIMLGLPVIGGLSAEFSNVKKAAQVDYDSFSGTCSALAARTAEVRRLVSQCASTSGEGGFVRELKGFLETAEKELKALTQEQKRIMEVVKKTTEYYQAGASKDQGAIPLQLFVIIRDFLGMVDQVCIEIARNLQRRRTSASRAGSSPKAPASRSPVRFPNLPEHFMKEKSMGSSSESDSDF